jgi:hypothetical protein
VSRDGDRDRRVHQGSSLLTVGHLYPGRKADGHIKNEDPTAEELDSSALEIEKVIGRGKDGTVRLRPLDPGRYPFMGEYRSDTAQGVVLAE